MKQHVSQNRNAKIPDMKTSTQKAKNWHIETTNNNTRKTVATFARVGFFIKCQVSNDHTKALLKNVANNL